MSGAFLATILLVAGIAAWAPQQALGQERAQPPISLLDPRLSELRIAASMWEGRPGPTRQVVDVVCLVPDAPTYLRAIASWDSGHYFPVLFDDAETSLKFIRAFHPARVVRFPSQPPTVPLAGDPLWDEAVQAVGRSWVRPDHEPPLGDRVPRLGSPTVPGVVLANAASPSSMGAVALAAGRFQPLVKWELARPTQDVMSEAEARKTASELADRVATVVTRYDKLGDDCDFVTLAIDGPYRYRHEGGSRAGVNALDDFLGRDLESGRRWAYVGRLIGGPAASVYRAMCALFLQPDRAALFNSYSDERPWNAYDMRPARQLFEGRFAIRHVQGARDADVQGWHRVFGPVNRAGLVLINTSGGPTDFSLPGGQGGQTADVPPSLPTVVLMIHSFSAANPFDPMTLAGRWLAQGAFIYYGSVNEPYLQAFRMPVLVSDLIADHVPIVAAVRATPGEPFGTPWRLIYLGDPLYRLLSREDVAPRIASWGPVGSWPGEAPGPRPGETASDQDKLLWAMRAARAAAAARAEDSPVPADLATLLLSLKRDLLSPEDRARRDALLANCLAFQPQDGHQARALCTALEEANGPDARRWVDTFRVDQVARALDAHDWERAEVYWKDLVASKATDDLKAKVTARVTSRSLGTDRLNEWRTYLGAVAHERPELPFLQKEIEKIDNQKGN